jgi:hypothetical protein
MSFIDAKGSLGQLKDTEVKDEEIAHVGEGEEWHNKTKQDLTAMRGVLVQLRNELDVYQRAHGATGQGESRGDTETCRAGGECPGIWQAIHPPVPLILGIVVGYERQPVVMLRFDSSDRQA